MKLVRQIGGVCVCGGGGGGTTDTTATNEGKVTISVCCWIGGLVYQEVSALCFIPQHKATET